MLKRNVRITIGSIVRVQPWIGSSYTGEVEEIGEKNGKTTYSLTNCSNGSDHWCYRDQIIEKLKK